jgi:uncharacterized protein (TIGR00251 family)
LGCAKAPITWQKSDLLMALYIQPKANQDKVVGLYADHIKIQITAPAVENKANEHLQKWLSKQCKVPLSQVILEKGQHSRYKLFRVQSPRQLPKWVNEILKDK